MIEMLGLSTRRSLYDIVNALGLTTNLQFVLDAGDALSYPGSGATWVDRLSPGSNDFAFGATTASPTFNGMAGRGSLSEYMSFDGGDYFTKASANSAFINSLHKDNALGSFAVMVYVPAFTTAVRLAGTSASSTANVGFDLGIETTGAMTWRVRNGAGNAIAVGSGSTLNAGAWNFVGFSIDESIGALGIDWNINGAATTATSTYSSPSAAAATYTMQLGAGGNANVPLLSGSRLGCVVGWSGKRSAAQLESLRKVIKNRYRLA